MTLGRDIRYLCDADIRAAGPIPNLADTDPFHGGGLAVPVRRVVLAAMRGIGQAAQRGRPESQVGPSRPTEGRHRLPAGVAQGAACGAKHRGATRAYPVGNGWR